MSEKDSLSVVEKVHRIQKEILPLLDRLKKTITGVLIISVFLIVWIMAQSNMIDSLGQEEFRIYNSLGPSCNPNTYNFQEIPAYVTSLMKNSDAANVGIKEFDIITKINHVSINKNADLINWQNNFPQLTPGDSIQVFIMRDNKELKFDVETIPSSTDSTIPLLGIYGIVSDDSCKEVFVLYQGQDVSANMQGIKKFGYVTIFIISALIVVLVIGFIWGRPEINAAKNNLIELENDYLGQHYVMTFNMTRPTGSTNGEKIYNLAQNVFSELKTTKGKPTKWAGILKGHDDYEFDCFQPENVGYSIFAKTVLGKTDEKGVIPDLFVAKHFGEEKITFEKLQELCHATNKTRKDKSLKTKFPKAVNGNILRLVCVGKNYDEQFLTKSYDEISDILDELDFEFHIDLILENKDGDYSILYIDFE